MFPSSSSSSGPYPCFPLSYPSFSFLNPENVSANNTFVHDPLPVPYIPTYQETLTNWAVSDGAAMLKQDLSGVHYGITRKPAKKPAKKDRHSKIRTSQGLRDRRVRLSIEIARKFFDLQDMLGFDKASNTLEWLFTKSKKAIEGLARSKNNSNCAEDDSFSFSSSSSEGEVVSLINQDLDLQQQEERVERKLKRAQKEPVCVQAKMKESREKARARARERTSNKLSNTSSTGNVQNLKKKCPATENPQILVHPEETAKSTELLQPHPHLVGTELPRDNDFNVVEESIVIKRKLKQSLMSSHHQNTVIPKEASFNNCDCHSLPMSPNWDANGATGRSNFCAIASINLSTGLQIFGKSWEECTSPRLY